MSPTVFNFENSKRPSKVGFWTRKFANANQSIMLSANKPILSSQSFPNITHVSNDPAQKTQNTVTLHVYWNCESLVLTLVSLSPHLTIDIKSRALSTAKNVTLVALNPRVHRYNYCQRRFQLSVGLSPSTTVIIVSEVSNKPTVNKLRRQTNQWLRLISQSLDSQTRCHFVSPIG